MLCISHVVRHSSVPWVLPGTEHVKYALNKNVSFALIFLISQTILQAFIQSLLYIGHCIVNNKLDIILFPTKLTLVWEKVLKIICKAKWLVMLNTDQRRTTHEVWEVGKALHRKWHLSWVIESWNTSVSEEWRRIKGRCGWRKRNVSRHRADKRKIGTSGKEQIVCCG